jgi:hypothetical protein
LSHALTSLSLAMILTFLLLLLFILELRVLALDVSLGAFCLLTGNLCRLEHSGRLLLLLLLLSS